MPRVAKTLTIKEIAKLQAEGWHAVGGTPGLLLQIKGASRTWVYRYTWAGQRKVIGLGPESQVTLAQARQKALEARNDLDAGKDPAEQRTKRQEPSRPAGGPVTFAQVAEAYIALHRAGWRNEKHAAQWESTIETYCPFLHKPVADVSKADVLAAVEPIWLTKHETASRLRARIATILEWAMNRGHRPEGVNPAELRKLGLPKRPKHAQVVHHAAMPYADLPAFWQRLQEVEGQGAAALRFCILTAARSGEVRGATWAEIDIAAQVWTLPASRMKAGKPHRVPLSTTALEVLPVPGKPGELVFPGQGKRGTAPLSDMTLAAVLRRMQLEAVTVHGMRSSFRDWTAEQTTTPNHVAEMALAHTIGDAVEAAYRRGDLFDQRRNLMQKWADYLTA